MCLCVNEISSSPVMAFQTLLEPRRVSVPTPRRHPNTSQCRVRREVSRGRERERDVVVDVGRPHGALVSLERADPVAGLALAQHRLAIYSHTHGHGTEARYQRQLSDAQEQRGRRTVPMQADTMKKPSGVILLWYTCRTGLECPRHSSGMFLSRPCISDDERVSVCGVVESGLDRCVAGGGARGVADEVELDPTRWRSLRVLAPLLVLLVERCVCVLASVLHDEVRLPGTVRS